MSINLSTETLVTLIQASQLLPGHPHISTLHRWRMRGVQGIKLETCRVGGRRFTSREALDRFCAATTAAAADGGPCPVRTPKQRQRDIEAAEAELASENPPDASVALDAATTLRPRRR